MGGSTASGAPGSSVNSNSMTHRPGSTTGMAGGTRAGPQYDDELIGNMLAPSGSPSGSTLTPTGPGSGLSR